MSSPSVVQQIAVTCRLHRAGASSRQLRSCGIGSLVTYSEDGQAESCFGVVAKFRYVSSGRYKLKLAKAYTVSQYKREFRQRKRVDPEFSSAHATAVNGLPAAQELILSDAVAYLDQTDIASLALLLDTGMYKSNPAFHGQPHVFFSNMEVDSDFDATFLDEEETPIRALGQLKMDLKPLPSTEVPSSRIAAVARCGSPATLTTGIPRASRSGTARQVQVLVPPAWSAAICQIRAREWRAGCQAWSPQVSADPGCPW